MLYNLLWPSQTRRLNASGTNDPRLLLHLPYVRQFLATIPRLLEGIFHFELLHLLYELGPLDPAVSTNLLILGGLAWIIWKLSSNCAVYSATPARVEDSLDHATFRYYGDRACQSHMYHTVRCNFRQSHAIKC